MITKTTNHAVDYRPSYKLQRTFFCRSYYIDGRDKENE